MAVTVLLGGDVIYKQLSSSSPDLENVPFIAGSNNTIIINQQHPITGKSENSNAHLYDGESETINDLERENAKELSPPLSLTAAKLLDKNQLHLELKRNLLINGYFLNYYEPAWVVHQNNKYFSRVNHKHQSVSLSYSGEGNGEKEVSLQQIIPVETVKDLVFSTKVKIFDRNEVGYAVVKVTMLDDIKNELFHFSITPDSLYESNYKHELILIPFNKIKTIQIPIGEIIKSKLPTSIISNIKYIAVSYEIRPPIHTRCKRCSIDVFESKLFYRKEKI